jgi:FkbM family methyltransferase
MRDFYACFVHRGDLVFDVGANVGEYCEIFSSLGARVVAVEPNPACCESLYRLAHMRDVRVEGCAVGESAGSAKMMICDQPAFSTLSEHWFERTKESPDHQSAKWLKSIDVPVTTLDALAQRHGVPAFVKIDVEGYEEKVLAGMSFRPAFLSFEFNLLAKDTAFHCLERLEQKGYEFNAIVGRELELCYTHWITCREASGWIASQERKCNYGDIFARQIH